MDGVRDGAKMQGAQRGSVWAHVRGVDMGKTCETVMCTLKGTWGVTVEVCGHNDSGT